MNPKHVDTLAVQIRRLEGYGFSARDVARALGCSTTTVYAKRRAIARANNASVGRKGKK